MKENVTTVTVDLGYSVMRNGDIVTSDGLPRGHFDEQAWIEQFGKPPTFRKPTPEEAADLARMNNALASQFDAFTELLK